MGSAFPPELVKAYAAVTVVTILSVVILLAGHCSALSENFLRFTSRIQNHSEVIYITDLWRWRATSNDSIAQGIGAEKQVSLVNQLNLDAAFLSKLDKANSQSTKFVIALSTVQQTLESISQVGSSPELQKFPIPPWVLALWPEDMRDEKEAERAIEEYLTKPAKNFTIKQELFLAFHPKNASSGSKATDADADGYQPYHYLVYEAYTINSQLIYHQVQDLGTTIVRCFMCSRLPDMRFSLHGILLRLVGVQDRQFNDDTLFTEDANGNPVLDTSLAKRLLEIMQASLNFTSKITRLQELGGKPLPNGTTTGAVKDVADDLYDICVTSTPMLAVRAKFVAFLPPTEESMVTAFFLPPSLNAIRDIFMQPFQPSLWAAVVTTWLSLAAAMVLFTVVRKKFGAQSEDSKRNANSEEPDFAHDSLIWALATVCQQGWDEHPHALSLRAIFISASFTGVIAYAGYSAAIVSTLSLRIDPIQSPEALIKSNLRLGLRTGFLNEELLQRDPISSKADIITEIRGRLSKRPNEGLVNDSAGTDLLLTQPYAFIGLKEGFYDLLKTTTPVKKYRYDIDTEICSIKELHILKGGFMTGMFTGKMFPYREYFRLILLVIHERGIMWRLRNEFSYTRRCLEASDNSGQALGANDVFTAFMVLSGGFFLSAVFLALEKLIRFNSVVYIR